MNAQETLFSILRELDKASALLDVPKELTTDELIQLSSRYRNLLDLSDDNLDLLFDQLKIEIGNDATFKSLCEKVVSKCEHYSNLYLLDSDKWDKQCLLDSIEALVIRQAQNEFTLRLEDAYREKEKWDAIYTKCNNITRYYNSMDCRPNQVKEDLSILNEECKQLQDLIGHPIRLETINEEHSVIRKTRQEKWEAIDIIKKKRQRREGELIVQIQENVIPVLFDFTRKLRTVFSKSIQSNNPVKNKRAGRPPKADKYKAEGITDLASCFIRREDYDKLVTKVKKRENPMSGNEVKNLFNVLFRAKWLKSSIESQEFFATLMINEFQDKMGFRDGHHVYSGKDHPDYKEDWKSLLNINDKTI